MAPRQQTAGSLEPIFILSDFRLFETLQAPALLPKVSHFRVSTSSSQQDAALIYEKTVTKTSSQAFSVLEHGAYPLSALQLTLKQCHAGLNTPLLLIF